MLKKSKNCNITKIFTSFNGKVKSYDFNYHMKIADRNLLKWTRDTGWMFKTTGITDSHILYRKIRSDTFKLKMVEYVVERINSGIYRFYDWDVDEDKGRFVLNVKDLDYWDLWNRYAKGEITTSQLRKILYY